ncbi:hypothetical protein GGR53DRAFT_532700 [Hypoxylon sp. FL1150]|nr:hypothetical protein GGR53DRAFT_532700 [Hypoxylon sp. FL1150]
MSAPRRIPPTKWEAHKDRIIELYLNQGLTLCGSAGRDGVVETMEREGFVATKSQYEARLRVWGARKNMTLEDWKRHAPDIQQSRERQITYDEEHSALRSDELSVSDETIHTFTDEAAPYIEGTLDGTLNELESSDPNVINFNYIGLHLNGTDISGLVGSISQTQVDDDPIIETNMALDSYFASNEMSTLGLSPRLNHAHPMLLPVTNNGISLTILEPLISSYTSSLGATHKAFPRELWIKPLPSSKIISLTRDRAPSTYTSLPGTSRNYLLGQFFSDVAAFAASMRPPMGPMAIKNPSPMASFPTVLDNLASEETFVGEEHDQFPVLSGDDAFESRFCSRLIKSLMNGFACLQDLPVSGVLRFLDRHTNTRSLLIQLLRSGPRCEAKSLAEGIFQAAIHADDDDVAKILLKDRLVDANDTIYSIDGQIYTPLALASQKQSFKVLQFLLDHGADVNKSHIYGLSLGFRFPLEFLLFHHGTRSTFQQDFLNLLSNFLNAGAIIAWN